MMICIFNRKNKRDVNRQKKIRILNLQVCLYGDELHIINSMTRDIHHHHHDFYENLVYEYRYWAEQLKGNEWLNMLSTKCLTSWPQFWHKCLQTVSIDNFHLIRQFTNRQCIILSRKIYEFDGIFNFNSYVVMDLFNLSPLRAD